MSLFDRLFGAPAREPESPRAAGRGDDERAIERYRYLLQTAPPETIERVHAEAFAKLTPEQRQMVFGELARSAPLGEAPADDEPGTLARAATRSELRNPGALERSLSGPSFGQIVGASLVGTVAGYVIGSALASAFLPPIDAGAIDAGAAPDAGAADAGLDSGGFADFGDFGF